MYNKTGAGIILKDVNNRILLVLGREHSKWSFPKGHFERSDGTLKRCAERETMEETGLDVSIPKDARYWVCSKYIYYFITTENIREFINRRDEEEITKVQWFSRDQLCDLSNGNFAVRKFVENMQARER
jgi:8-oxo-dGTP pyrophosphatase MutT (NUDIX family)